MEWLNSGKVRLQRWRGWNKVKCAFSDGAADLRSAQVKPMDSSTSTRNILVNMMSITSKHLVNREIPEHFDVVHELGRGSYGHVVLAKQRDSGLSVALKLLPKNGTQRDAFLLEFSVSVVLGAHPNIISTLMAAWQTVDHFVFAQEVAPAGNLDSLLIPGVGIQEIMVKRCVSQLCSALDYMHSLGLVHRDIKPDNVMLMDPECHCVKLSDFGLTSLTGFNITAMSCINPYMAPELCRLRHPNTIILHPSLDVWALAVLILTTMTGFFPWERALPSDRHYKDLYWWQVRGPSSPVPSYWQRFTPQAHCFMKQMLTFDPLRRCSAIKVQQYLSVPWKTENILAVVRSDSEEEEDMESQEEVESHQGDVGQQEEVVYQGEVEQESEVKNQESISMRVAIVFVDDMGVLLPDTSLVVISDEEVSLTLGAELEIT
ncbi:serine/threonine-protein kinase SBK1-like [Ambystoma mexicanum]|uniref:serine/threonine-protein kinase SBK1-like n=1 Tax=Ambystoma mexicanum TaxID=8296 RepID=UPI0037E81EA0